MSSPFSLRVQLAIDRHRMLVPGDRPLVGVSGGADSVCLLLALVELGYPVGVAHLNHGLRGESSDGDERFVGALAAGLGVPFFARRATIGSNDGNTEAAGRRARREFMQEVCAESGFTKIALGHSCDDRAETFLLNLMRGAGADGLTAMAPVSGACVPIVRPLIEIRRHAIEAYLGERGQTWRTDATNLDVTLARNRVRHLVIPELARSFNPRLIESLTRTIEVLSDEDACLAQISAQWVAAHARWSEDGNITVESDALAALAPALQRRAIRAILRWLRSSLDDVTFERIEQIRTLSRPGKSGRALQVPGNCEVVRELDKIVFRPGHAVAGGFEYQLAVPGAVEITELGQIYRARVVEPGERSEYPEGSYANIVRVFVDGGRLGAYVKIRSWKPGDYYRPAGLPAGKLKKLFLKARIPRSRRSVWPVFVMGESVIWVPSFPVSREFALSPQSKRVVALEAI